VRSLARTAAALMFVTVTLSKSAVGTVGAADHASDDKRDPRSSSGLQESLSTQEARRRWFDDHRGQTSLLAFFVRPNDPPCFVLGGLFLIDRSVEFVFPAALTPAGGGGSLKDDGSRILTLRDEHCRLNVRVSKEVLRNGQWVKLVPHR
jgi:hypothetical protein